MVEFLIGAELVLGVVVFLYTLVRPLQDKPVSLWAATVGPLIVLLAFRHMDAQLLPGLTPEEFAERTLYSVPLGGIEIGLGALAVLVGAFSRYRGERRGAPELVMVGAWMIIAGLLWSPVAHTHVALWTHWDAPLEQLEQIRKEGEQLLLHRALGAVGVAVVLFLPGLFWAFRRRGWGAIADVVAAVTLFLLFLTTGTRVRTVVEEAFAPWMTACVPLAGKDVSMPSGDVSVVGRPFVQDVVVAEPPESSIGTAYEEHLVEGAWQAGEESVWMVTPMEARAIMQEQDAKELLVAGYTADPVPLPAFGRHPVMVAARCRAHRVALDPMEDLQP